MVYDNTGGAGLMTKQPYQNVGLQLRQWILSEIETALSGLTKALPCKIITNNGQTVDVEVTVNIGMPLSIIKKVPIAKTKYLNLPLAAGDLGLLIPSNYLFNSLAITDITAIKNPKPATTISGYIFVPFTNYAQDYAGNGVNNNTKIFSQNGLADIEITNTDIKFKTNEEILWSKLKTWLDNYQINYNTNMTIIKAGLTALGYAPASGITNYTATYR